MSETVSTRLERQSSLSERQRRALGWAGYTLAVLGLAGAGHVGGVTATQAFPERVNTPDYRAAISLEYTSINEVRLPLFVGGVEFRFESPVPAAGIEVKPELEPGILATYVRKGTKSAELGGRGFDEQIDSAWRGLAAKYATGIIAAELLAAGLYMAGARRVSRRTGAAVATAAVLACSYQGAAAYHTYAGENYSSYNLTGLAGSEFKDGKAMLDALGKRSEQIQPYVASWLALKEDLSRTIGPFEEDKGPGGPKFLLVSDIHGVDMTTTIKQLAEKVGADAIIDTGDIANYGHLPEVELTGILTGIEKLGIPYIFVAGNHDKNSARDQSLIERLQKLENVIVLEPDAGSFNIVSVGGVKVAGVNDPRWFGDDNQDNMGAQAPAVKKFNDMFASNPPDIAISHEPAAAEQLATNGVQMAGHIHHDELRGKLIINGTLTGGGLFGQGDTADDTPPVQSYSVLEFGTNCRPARLSVTRFSGGVTGTPRVESVSIYPLPDKTAKPVAERECNTKNVTATRVLTRYGVQRAQAGNRNIPL